MASVEVEMNQKQQSMINYRRHRYPYCIVWTPIPVITWLFPFIGHMGIATSSGIIRDFAGSYYVSEDDMAFGWPTRYLQLNIDRVCGGDNGNANDIWDRAVSDASDEYKTHMHNIFCDNCHSHVALALNQMNYDRSSRWNMFRLAANMFICGKYTGISAFIRHWLPVVIFFAIFIVIIVIPIKFADR